MRLCAIDQYKCTPEGKRPLGGSHQIVQHDDIALQCLLISRQLAEAPAIYHESGTLAGRTIRGELHELRDLHVDAE